MLISMNSANFREISMGEIAPGILYRCNHPIYNGKQVNHIIFLVTNAKIKTIINISDSMQSLRSKVSRCPWYEKMLAENNVIALNISMKFDILAKGFINKIGQGIRFLIEHEPPYLIHCEAGIDRTGFLSILLEAFMGAHFDDIVKDYMLSFVENNEYSIKDYKTGSVFVRNLFSEIKRSIDSSNDDLQYLSSKYLTEKTGLGEKELTLIKDRLGNSYRNEA